MNDLQNEWARAIKWTVDLFGETNDMGGKPYILHCFRVMNAVYERTGNIKCAIVGVCHDNVEDHFHDVEKGIEAFKELVTKDEACVDALRAMTHLKDESYADYIHRVSRNQIARMIKICDLEDNTDITRLKGLREKDFERLQKYHKSYCYLTGQHLKLLDL